MSLSGSLSKVRFEAIRSNVRVGLTHTLLGNRFPDEQVLKGTFVQELEKVVRVLRPLVHW